MGIIEPGQRLKLSPEMKGRLRAGMRAAGSAVRSAARRAVPLGKAALRGGQAAALAAAQRYKRWRSTPFTVVPGNAQFLGARDRQEDALACSDFFDLAFVRHGGYLGVVADGMGGMAYGREASQAAVKVFLDAYVKKHEQDGVTIALANALQAANDAVLLCAERLNARSLLGTTLVAAVCFENRLYWISVGDSRLYLIRDGKARQLTTDHIFAAELDRQVQQNVIGATEALEHPERDHLTSYLGDDVVQEIDQNLEGFPLEPGDRIVLCTDGVYRTLSLEEMERLSGSFAGDYAEELIAAVRAKNIVQQDNATVVTMTPKTRLALPRSRVAVPRIQLSPAIVFWIAAAALIWVTWYFTQPKSQPSETHPTAAPADSSGPTPSVNATGSSEPGSRDGKATNESGSD